MVAGMNHPVELARAAVDAARMQHRLARATTTHLVAPPDSTSPERFDERSLVESARHDASAFAELYRRYVHRIHAYAFRRSGSRQVADDVTSATFEKALRGLASYRWREPGIGPWLFRIASNEFANYYRSDAKQARAAASLQAAAIRSSMVRTDEFGEFGEFGDGEVVAALGKIRPRYQRALSLRYLADLTNEEAAAAMGVSRATMAVIVHRGAAALRKVIEASRVEEVMSNG